MQQISYFNYWFYFCGFSRRRLFIVEYFFLKIKHDNKKALRKRKAFLFERSSPKILTTKQKEQYHED